MRDSTGLALAVLALAILLFLPLHSFAGDAAEIYKTKCSACHGADGQANTPMGKKQQIPSFASDKVQKASSAEIQDYILDGGKEKRASHAFANKGLTQDDAAKLAAYLRELGKKR